MAVACNIQAEGCAGTMKIDNEISHWSAGSWQFSSIPNSASYIRHFAPADSLNQGYISYIYQHLNLSLHKRMNEAKGQCTMKIDNEISHWSAGSSLPSPIPLQTSVISLQPAPSIIVFHVYHRVLIVPVQMNKRSRIWVDSEKPWIYTCPSRERLPAVYQNVDWFGRVSIRF
jgi:hypothetical protein